MVSQLCPIDILGPVSLFLSGAILCIVGCLTTSLTSTQQMQQQKCLQTLPNVTRGEKSPQLRTMILERALEHLRALGHSRILWKGKLTLQNSLRNIHAPGHFGLPVPFLLLVTAHPFTLLLPFISIKAIGV